MSNVVGNASIAVTTISSNTAIPVGASFVLITPAAGATSEIFFNFGPTNSVTAATSGPAVPPNGIELAVSGKDLYLAAITLTGTATLRIIGLSSPTVPH